MSHAADFLVKKPAHRLLVIKSAADHASRAHKGQFRKDQKTPYITHPARVAGLVGIFNGSHMAVIAAWLHDAPPEATLIKICDRIDNLLDSADRNGGFTKRYLVSTDEVIEKLSVRASLYGYNAALDILVQIRNSNLKKL
jgi:(p)ppGpp synthase/HD superfamily hydrolase